MAVITFGEDEKLYHYPPLKTMRGAGLLTMCGLKKAKGLTVIEVTEAIPNDWEPCPDCAAIDEHDKHFVGRVL